MGRGYAPAVTSANRPGAVGERIRALRMARGVGLGQLADQSGVSKGYLSALETGTETNPSLDVLNKVARALQVTLADLLDTPRIKGKLELPEELPPALKDYISEQKRKGITLDTATIIWLANAQFRGKSITRDDYAMLHRLVAGRNEDSE
jgi:XRE family transcriptional regulator, master regulator for biofilm formation